MPNPNSGLIHEHTDNIESIALPGLPEAIYPHLRRSRQLSALAPSNRFDWAAKVIGAASFNLDEDDGVVAFYNQVDIPVSIPKPATQHSPSLPPQPV